MKYNMPKLIEILTEWMKEAGVYDERKPLSFSMVGNKDLEIISGDAGKLIGAKGKLVSKYTNKLAEYCNNKNIHVSVTNPDVMISVGSNTEDVIVYYKNNI